MKALDNIALALLIIGGLNWLLVGLFEFDLVATLFNGQDSLLSKVVYILVGLSALYSLKFFGLINAPRHDRANVNRTDTVDRTDRTADRREL